MNVPYDQCPSCGYSHTEGWGCPFCGFIIWRKIIPAVLLSLVLLSVAIIGGALFRLLRFMPPELAILLRVVMGILGAYILIFSGWGIYTGLRPRTQRVRAVLVCAGNKDLEGIVRGMTDPDSWVRYVAYLQADRFAPEEYRSISHGLRAQASASLMEELSGAPTGDDRGMWIVTLGRLGDMQAAEPLLPFLQDPDESVRQDAAWALGHIGHWLADPGRREKVTTGLIAALEGPDDFVWHQAAWALGRVKDHRVVKALSTAIHRRARDEDSAVPYYAAKGLGLIGAPALPAVRDLLTDADPKVRLVGVWALDEIQRQKAGLRLRKEVHKLLIDSLVDTNEDVRSAAREALPKRILNVFSYG